jgi:hypothetical protein
MCVLPFGPCYFSRISQGAYGVAPVTQARAHSAVSGTLPANRRDVAYCGDEWGLAPFGSLSRRNSSDIAEEGNSSVGRLPGQADVAATPSD